MTRLENIKSGLSLRGYKFMGVFYYLVMGVLSIAFTILIAILILGTLVFAWAEESDDDKRS